MKFPKEVKKFVKNKNIKTNIFIIQANESIMWGYFSIGFIDSKLSELDRLYKLFKNESSN